MMAHSTLRCDDIPIVVFDGVKLQKSEPLDLMLKEFPLARENMLSDDLLQPSLFETHLAAELLVCLM